MRAVGLGNHFSWFNGSGSCAYIRRDAVRKLPEALRAHDLTPHRPLMRVLERVAEQEGQYDRDGGRHVLTKTWQAVSTAIRAHMDGDPAGAVDYIERTFIDPMDRSRLWRDIKGAAYDAKVREMRGG